MARKRAESPLSRRRRKKKKNRKKKGNPEVLRGFHQANAAIQQPGDKRFIFCLPDHLHFEY